ncbi:MAG: hypothetical protein MJ159_02050, partial [Treponemataceae bacterium]|nr:hypothetical protein [Treponemataceae bacterium]
EYLMEKKKETDIPLYYETDTHWNPLGAYYTFQIIEDKLKETFPEISFPETVYDINVEYSYDKGDIIPMLGIDNAFCTRPELNPKGMTFEDCYESIESRNRFNHTKNKISSDLPKAIIFGDSFLDAIEPYLAATFSDAQFLKTHFSDEQKDFILKNKPDFIIFEKVERVAPWFVE